MSEEGFGGRLRKLRRQAGFTQKALAAELHTSRGNISMYENGARVPRDEVKVKLADYYNTTVQDLSFSRDVTNSDTKVTN